MEGNEARGTASSCDTGTGKLFSPELCHAEICLRLGASSTGHFCNKRLFGNFGETRYVHLIQVHMVYPPPLVRLTLALITHVFEFGSSTIRQVLA